MPDCQPDVHALLLLQPMMHASFPEETRLLQTAFASMGGISGAYVLGDALKGLQWHVFVARSAAAQQQPVS